MNDILIRNVTWCETQVDVAICGKRISAIEPAGTLAQERAVNEIDGGRFFMRAPFYNTHTHHAMTLLRGIDDDCALMDWLTRCIWPREAKLTPEAVAAGTRLAILESIKSGCVAFNDMYFHQPTVACVAQEMGVRACVGLMYMDMVSEHIENDALWAMRAELPETVRLTVAPHALYTTSPELLKKVALQAQKHGLLLHTHAAESVSEVNIARERFGMTPMAYLDACGILQEGAILAHCCHLTEADIELMAKRKVVVAHCPQSNQKLASGVFPYAKVHAAGVTITVGTDGAASNNSLAMIAETKAAALSAKLNAGAPDALSIAQLDTAVTQDAAKALGFDNAGKIAVGADADIILVNKACSFFVGGGSLTSNFLYAADASCIDTVICAGRILMQQRYVPHEEEILDAAQRSCACFDRSVGELTRCEGA